MEAAILRAAQKPMTIANVERDGPRPEGVRSRVAALREICAPIAAPCACDMMVAVTRGIINNHIGSFLLTASR